VPEAIRERTVIQKSLAEALAERLEARRIADLAVADPEDFAEAASTDGAVGGPAADDAEAGLPVDGVDLRAHLFAIEHRLISEALERSGGTVAHAARLLNLRRTTLVEKLRKFGMAEPEGLQG
jgi:sigma-54 specific flagellar transcriptional regulator A